MLISHDDPLIIFQDEYNLYQSVFYNGSAFTGTLYDDSENEKTEFKDGDANGRSWRTGPDGQVIEDNIYLNGKWQSGKTFYENGQFREELDLKNSRRWNEEGILIQENNTHFYENGTVRIQIEVGTNGQAVQFFTRNGILAFFTKEEADEVTYMDDVLHQYYSDLLLEVTNEEWERQRIHHIHMWLWKVLDNNPKQYFEMVNQLLHHPSRNVVLHFCEMIALHKLHAYIEEGIEANQEAYELIRQYSLEHDERNPKRPRMKIKFKRR